MRKKNRVLYLLVLLSILLGWYQLKNIKANPPSKVILSTEMVFGTIYKEFPNNPIDFEIFKKALIGYFNLHSKNHIENHLLTIIDFSQSSNTERLWILDVQNRKVIHSSLVAHGKNSGEEFATRFSNIPSSYQSSIGFYVTDNTYLGKHGLSLFLNGMESNINDKARERAIVMHGADYVSKEYIHLNGRLGRSFGCPSIPMSDHERIINLLSGKSCLFIHYPDADYLKYSALLSLEDAWDEIFAFYSLTL
jgi:hypothetical protein